MSFGTIAASYFTLAGGGGNTAYTDAVMQDSPLVYLKFDETSGTIVADSSGNGRDGIYGNSPTLGQYSIVPGDIGHSFYADNGTGGAPPSRHVSVPYGSWMDAGAVTVTFCCFATTGTYRLWVSRYGEPGSNWSWFVYVNSDRFQFHYRSSGGVNTNIDSGVTVEAGKRYYVAAYAGPSGCGIRIYDESGLVGSATGAGGTVNPSTRNLTLMDAETFNYKTTGYMDELAVFGTVISTARLDELAELALRHDPWITQSAGMAARNGTTGHTISFMPAQAGSLLVAVVATPAANTAVTSGWTKRLSPSVNGELSVFTRTASTGDTTLQIAHTAVNLPMAYAVYEFPSGSAWHSGNSSTTYDTYPALSGLLGTPIHVFAAGAKTLYSGSPPWSINWWHFWHNSYNQWETPGVTEGICMNIGCFIGFPDTTADVVLSDGIGRDDINPAVSALFAVSTP